MMSIPIFFLQHLSRLSSILCLFRGFLGLDLGLYTPAAILWLHELNFKMLSHLLLSPRQEGAVADSKYSQASRETAALGHWGYRKMFLLSICESQASCTQVLAGNHVSVHYKPNHSRDCGCQKAMSISLSRPFLSCLGYCICKYRPRIGCQM